MKSQRLLLLQSILCTFLMIIMLETKSHILALKNNSISAIFVFGDSTVDPGNNNYVETLFKSNYPPYGRDFPNQIPTGRFSNGRLVTDYIGSYLGIKECVPPYLDSTLSLNELMTGVSFASAASGLDPFTAHLSNVIPIPKQLEYFREYKRKLEGKIGKERSLTLIKKAAFLISAGTNDFAISYFFTQIQQRTYTIVGYQQFLFHQLLQLIKGLQDEGAQLIGVVGLPPIGCLPVIITLFSDDLIHNNGRDCIEYISSVARDYNIFLQNKLSEMQTHGMKIIYADIYTPIYNIIQDHDHKFGFDVMNKGCCGSGILETGLACNSNSYVCDDASKYLFWDSVHPTQAAYYTIFQSLIPIIDRFSNI